MSTADAAGAGCACERDPVLPLAEVQPVVGLEQACIALGISYWAGRDLVHAGTFPVPVLRLGRIFRVPVAPLRRLLGLPVDEAPSPAAATPEPIEPAEPPEPPEPGARGRRRRTLRTA